MSSEAVHRPSRKLLRSNSPTQTLSSVLTGSMYQIPPFLDKEGGNEKNIIDDRGERKLATRSLTQLRAMFDVEELRCEERRAEAERGTALKQELQEELAAAARQAQEQQAAVQRLQGQVSEAVADAHLLQKDLPMILIGRQEELQQYEEEAAALRAQEAEDRRAEESFSETRLAREAEVDELMKERKAWQAANTSLLAQRQTIDNRACALGAGRDRARSAVEALQVYLRRSAVLDAQQVHDVSEFSQERNRLVSELATLNQSQEEAMSKQCDSCESGHLAARLETDRLRRSLALRQQRLKEKAAEAAWWQERTKMLDRELAQLGTSLVRVTPVAPFAAVNSAVVRQPPPLVPTAVVGAPTWAAPGSGPPLLDAPPFTTQGCHGAWPTAVVSHSQPLSR